MQAHANDSLQLRSCIQSELLTCPTTTQYDTLCPISDISCFGEKIVKTPSSHVAYATGIITNITWHMMNDSNDRHTDDSGRVPGDANHENNDDTVCASTLYTVHPQPFHRFQSYPRTCPIHKKPFPSPLFAETVSPFPSERRRVVHIHEPAATAVLVLAAGTEH